MILNNQRAFTLAETLIVITIIIILTTVAFVGFRGVMDRSRDAAVIDALSSLQTESGIQRLARRTISFVAPNQNRVVADTVATIEREIVGVGNFQINPTTAQPTGALFHSPDASNFCAFVKLHDGRYWCTDAVGFNGEVFPIGTPPEIHCGQHGVYRCEYVAIVEPLANLHVTPTSIVFDGIVGEGLANQTFSVHNTGGGTLSWSQTNNIVWMETTPPSGSLTAGAVETVTVNPTDCTTIGTATGTITVTGAGETIIINVTRNCLASPDLYITPTSIVFDGIVGESLANQSFTVQNTGGGTLSWSQTNNIVWMETTPPSGSLTAGAVETVTANPTDCTAIGTTTGTITITGAGETIIINVTRNCIAPPNPPNLHVTPISIVFDGIVDQHLSSQSFTIQNTGGGTLSWSQTDDMFWMVTTPVSGSLTAGVSETVTLNPFDCAAAGTLTGTITVTGAEEIITISVTQNCTDPVITLELFCTGHGGFWLNTGREVTNYGTDWVETGADRWDLQGPVSVVTRYDGTHSFSYGHNISTAIKPSCGGVHIVCPRNSDAIAWCDDEHGDPLIYFNDTWNWTVDNCMEYYPFSRTVPSGVWCAPRWRPGRAHPGTRFIYFIQCGDPCTALRWGTNIIGTHH